VKSSDRLLFAIAFVITGCATQARDLGKLPEFSFPECRGVTGDLSFGNSDQQGVDARELLKLTEWVKTSKAPVLSILLSRDGQVIYELYTSSLDRASSHYLMSVTKSVTSALIGVALDRHFVKSIDDRISDLLPSSLFGDQATVERFQKISLQDVLGMSALDAPIFPHLDTEAAKVRLTQFVHSKNRVAFALSQEILPDPGTSFQYTDVTPAIAAGVIQYATNESLYDFANQALFEPMGFQNQEWMHEDASGIDNGAYGLRLRPIDMQKFGLLYLNEGCWQGRRLLSREWVKRSFTPWIRSKPDLRWPDYGWYWWHYSWGNGWSAHIAAGWKGQRIAVFPEKNVVLTMTAVVEDGTEDQLFGKIFSFVSAAVDRGISSNEEASGFNSRLKMELEELRTGPTRITESLEARMIPSVRRKETHRVFSAHE
jgi:CubicO group peptidase (beta-lactamase class C family)